MGFLRELRRKINTPGWRLVSGVAVSLSLVGCAQVAPLTSLNPLAKSKEPAATQAQSQTQGMAESQIQPSSDGTTQATAAAPTPAAVTPADIRTAAVRRGPISDILLLNGRVAGVDETPLSAPGNGSVETIYVQPGATVKQGQPLLDLDSKQAQKDLQSARSKLQTANDALTRGQHLAAQAQQQTNDRRDAAVAEDQTRLRQAQSALDQVRAGASTSDKQAADATVLQAQNVVDKAKADLAKAVAPADPTALRTAQQQVESAQVGLQSAQADQAKLTTGPDPAAELDAQRSLAAAKSAKVSAQADLQKLTSGPDPFDLRAAQRAVDTAQASLDAASSSDSKDTRTAAQKDAAIRQANAALQDAQDKLAKLRQAPDQTTVQLAQAKVDDATAQIAGAQEKLNELHQPPDQVALAKAQQAVDSSQTTLDNAKASQKQLQDGTSSNDLQALKNALDAANAGLASAQTKRDEVYGRPTAPELSSAEDAVNAAQQAVTKAQNGSTGQDSATGPDLQALQQAVSDATAEVNAAQASVDATHLSAPADAVIAQVLVHSGDIVDASKPAIILAQSSQPVIRVNLLDGKMPKLVNVGNHAQVQLDGSDQALDGVVADFAPPAANGDRIALINVDWGSVQSAVGTGARASITVQHHDNALILPLRAIRSVGVNQYVEVLDGSSRKSIPVELGIVSGTDAEIVSGLREGQTVILDTSQDGGPASRSATPTAASRGRAATPAATASAPTAPELPLVADGPAPTATPGPSAPRNVLTAALATTNETSIQTAPVLEDWFLNNTRNWPSNPQGTAWIANGAYNIATRNPAQFVTIAVPGLGDLRDVTMTGSFRKTGGPGGGGYGLVLRARQSAGALDGTTQTGRYYVFEASDQGQFGIWLRDNDQWVEVVPWTSDASVRRGTETNELTVSAEGDQFTFSINGLQVATEMDSRLRSGQVGVFVGGDSNEVALEHLEVVPLPPTI